MLPKKWGQGQLFAFSALDSDSYFSDDFCGILSGEKVGVVFYTQCKRNLFFGNMNKFISPEFECVTSDMILQRTLLGSNSIIFAQRHLVVGEYCDMLGVFANADGECEVTKKDDIEIHNTKDGEYTALLRRKEKYAFAYGKSECEVVDLCKKGINLDIDELKEIKKKPFENKLSDDDKYASLYAKCISVMRSQLYSPEGNIKRIWSTPDRLPHRNMWLWDSVFHAVGHRNIDPALAESLILTLFDVQREDGFIPHMARPNYISDITQPPIIAWGAWLVYEKSGNKDFLKTVFENNKRFLLWCKDNRRDTEKELYTWYTNEDANNRCDESGMDNSPRFDVQSRLFAIDFCCYMANELRYMKKIATEIDDADSAENFENWFGKVRDDINNTLWCEADNFYYDYDITNGRFNKVESVSSFLPLFAGVCDEDKARKLISHLKNSESFYSSLPVPTISKKDKHFGTDLWRGPVWINYNYMIIKGLRDYGYFDFADEIKGKTLDIVDMWYKRTGTVYEFYDSENNIPPSCFNRKGPVYDPYDFRVKYQTIRDYGWSITLTFDLLNE